jgi:hypothetical protein
LFKTNFFKLNNFERPGKKAALIQRYFIDKVGKKSKAIPVTGRGGP